MQQASAGKPIILCFVHNLAPGDEVNQKVSGKALI